MSVLGKVFFAIRCFPSGVLLFMAFGVGLLGFITNSDSNFVAGLPLLCFSAILFPLTGGYWKALGKNNRGQPPVCAALCCGVPSLFFLLESQLDLGIAHFPFIALGRLQSGLGVGIVVFLCPVDRDYLFHAQVENEFGKTQRIV